MSAAPRRRPEGPGRKSGTNSGKKGSRTGSGTAHHAPGSEPAAKRKAPVSRRPRGKSPPTARPVRPAKARAGAPPSAKTSATPSAKPSAHPQVEVRFEVPRAALPMTQAKLRARIAEAVALTGFAGRLSVAIVGDAAMRVLNLDFHACDEPTDVLAFALERPPGTEDTDGFDAEVILSLDTARLEAAERGVTLAAEVLLYVVHGTLHLMGEDDHHPVTYRRMHARALAVLAALGEANTIDPPHKKLRRGRRA